MIKKKIIFPIILGATIAFTLPSANVLAAVTNGWELSNDTWYYYENGSMVTSKWVKHTDGKWYYLNSNGSMAKSKWIKHTDGKWYYLGSDGAMVTYDWIKHTDGKYYFVDANGVMLASTTTPDGYYVDSTGAWDSKYPSYPGSYIKSGSTGKNVSYIQARLNILKFNAGSVDGTFGSGTKSALMAFQKSKGLTADGVVGQDTWKALFGGGTSGNSGNSSSSSISSKQQALVTEANKHLGKKYVFGATGPNTFDCSGLTQYVYRNALGIEIGRNTTAQLKSGKAITSQSQLQVGDLVFTSSGHVGLYIGNNKIIHAPQTGDVVKVSTIWSFYTARRIL